MLDISFKCSHGICVRRFDGAFLRHEDPTRKTENLEERIDEKFDLLVLRSISLKKMKTGGVLLNAQTWRRVSKERDAFSCISYRFTVFP